MDSHIAFFNYKINWKIDFDHTYSLFTLTYSLINPEV